AGAGAGDCGVAGDWPDAGAVGRADRDPERIAGAGGGNLRAAAGRHAQRAAGARHPAPRLWLEHELPGVAAYLAGRGGAGRAGSAAGGALSGLAQPGRAARPGLAGGAMRRLVLVLLVMALAGLGYWLWRQEEPPATGRFSVQGLLGGALEDYARADRVRPLRFPRDHGAHPDYRSEWWYLTGNLEDEAGRRYGFQFTIFRLALSPQPRPGSSAWGTRQAYMGHFAVTDVAGGGFYAFERFSRGALGLAGGEAQPFRVWLHDWHLRAQDDGSWPWLLQAAEAD